jgi:ribosomal protein S27E
VDCPNCGAGITIQRADTKSITCSNCHSTVGVEQGGVALLVKYAGAEVVEPPLPIGQKGVVDGRSLQVVGFLQRYVVEDGERYFWDEYLLLEEKTGQYVWLTCGEDGWKIGELTGTTPEQRSGGAVVYEGKGYNLVENGTAVTDYVLGEFNWRVKQGDKAWYQTFRMGDTDLSMERTGNEVTWTQLKKTTGAALSKAFGVNVPEAGGSHGTPAFGAVPPGSGASAGIGCGMIILIIVVVIIILILLSARRDCDPRYENCSSSTSSYSRGSSGGFGGGHK